MGIMWLDIGIIMESSKIIIEFFPYSPDVKHKFKNVYTQISSCFIKNKRTYSYGNLTCPFVYINLYSQY